VPPRFSTKFPKKINRVKLSDNRDRNRVNSEIQSGYQKRPFLTLVSSGRGPQSVLTGKVEVKSTRDVSNEIGSPIRCDQALDPLMADTRHSIQLGF
jgi:hypothetical protein